VAKRTGALNGVPSGSHHTGKCSDSRQKGGLQSDTKKSWRDVATGLPSKLPHRSVNNQPQSIPKPIPDRPIRKPILVKRKKSELAKLHAMFTGQPTSQASRLYAHHPNPGDIKGDFSGPPAAKVEVEDFRQDAARVFAEPSQTKPSTNNQTSSGGRKASSSGKPKVQVEDDNESLASTIEVVPLTEANLRRHNAALPVVVWDWNVPSSSGGDSSGSSESSHNWEEVKEPCLNVYGPREVRKYHAKLDYYDVPVGRFRGIWSSRLTDSKYSQLFGRFFRGEFVRVRLPVAIVGNVSKFWAHTLHDDKLDNFLVSVSRTKALCSEAHFDDPMDEVLAAMYVPVYCYIKWWSEQQALNSVVRETTTSRSWFATVPLMLCATTVGLAVGHVAVPIMIVASVASGISSALGLAHWRYGRATSTRFQLPALRN
jgi:hypothetical protein